MNIQVGYKKHDATYRHSSFLLTPHPGWWQQILLLMCSSKLQEKRFTNFALDFLMGGVSAAVSKTTSAPIECVKLLIQNQDEMIKAGRLTVQFLSLLGRVITNGASLASYPIDTVRRRMMMTSAVKYKSSMATFTQILKNEGAGANILRAVAGAGVLSGCS